MTIYCRCHTFGHPLGNPSNCKVLWFKVLRFRVFTCHSFIHNFHSVISHPLYSSICHSFDIHPKIPFIHFSSKVFSFICYIHASICHPHVSIHVISIHLMMLTCSLVEVDLKAQNAIWNFRTPHDHKHLHNNFFSYYLPFTALWPQALSQYIFVLLPSFHGPWIIVTIINYIDNKRNSIAIRFLCCHKYSRWSGWACFFLTAIITIMEGLGLFFYCCHKYSRWWDLFAFSLTMQWWRGITSLWQRMKFWRSWACLLYKELIQRLTRTL